MSGSFDLKKSDKTYTYADYLNWPDDERLELINGVPYLLAPSPSRQHQEVVMALSATLYQALRNHPCRVYTAPLDVRLANNQDEQEAHIINVVQPDIVVVCDPAKLDDRGVKGAPDLIIEVTSPSTATNDYIHKRKLYEQHGVKEYWIVHPIDHIVMVYLLHDQGQYEGPGFYSKEDEVPVRIIPGVSIKLEEIFSEKTDQ
ncbi:Uma2 family endonuclease [Caldalkalibacillus thermarum TA2.A1]|uniref:Uma2 family endonuclease n=1 Tax=Caldalkalibacillus thermarum (strain TA2.A1) TaxID=986075 RepID=A0A8X8I974_CALTT|nr:Uma2 family endonuclease [Caldalkalibacillus thermarum]QZT33961.1 Uma2 family endonuclease [Caldalkalibacillus thermarum TA2.A1]